MDEYILKTNNLKKSYKKKNALDDFNISIKKGDIYALIGKNGAGKTTLIRVITGLTAKTSGELELFGEVSEQSLVESRKRIGCLIETPSLDMEKTAYDNLNINRKLKGIKGRECIKEVLKTVGLEGVRGKKVKNYSLGMKQRLGLAKALLGNPDFLILDEPINGLDPMGIIEMRELFLKLNKEQGVTILIASHILKELSLVATRYGIINEGKIVDEFSQKDLEDKCQKYVHIKVNNTDKAVEILKNDLNATNFQILPDNRIKLFDFFNEAGKVNIELLKGGVIVEEIMPYVEELESYFTRVVGGADYDKLN